MYTPEGYINDPPDAKCPHCNEKNKACSYLDKLNRIWARDECFKKNKKGN